MFIQWEKIVLKNFMSYGNEPTTFYFNKSPTTLIVGQNGVGKSSIIEAFVFAIKGNTYRGSNKNELINTTNQRDCLIELHFTKNNIKYVIYRGMKNSVFYITEDGKKIEESASIRDMQAYLETQVLQTSVTGIIKTSILGCDYKPFMMMSAKEKRDLIETLLEINVFTEMNKVLKNKIVGFKEEYNDFQNEMKITEGVLASKKELYERLRDSNTRNSEKEKEELKIIKKRIDDIEKQINDKNEILKGMVFHTDINKVKNDIAAYEKDIDKLEFENDSKLQQIDKLKAITGECTECGTAITQDHKDKHIAAAGVVIAVNNADIDTLNDKCSELDIIVEEYNQFMQERNRLTNEINSLLITFEHVKETGIQKVRSYKELLKNETTGIDKHKEDYESTKEYLESLKERDKGYSKQKAVYNLATQLLKDEGIKSTIVNQYIPVLNQSVNYYLQSLNSPIRFNIDKNLDVRLDSRYPGEFSYHTLSMGERQRIDLSMSFAWRKVASIKNTVNTNLLILDETFDASIDGDGTDDLLAILEDIQKSGVNIFVISHKGGLEDKLRSTIKIEKKNGFSRIKQEITNN